jgi:hypothetical protein
LFEDSILVYPEWMMNNYWPIDEIVCERFIFGAGESPERYTAIFLWDQHDNANRNSFTRLNMTRDRLLSKQIHFGRLWGVLDETFAWFLRMNVHRSRSHRFHQRSFWSLPHKCEGALISLQEKISDWFIHVLPQDISY